MSPSENSFKYPLEYTDHSDAHVRSTVGCGKRIKHDFHYVSDYIRSFELPGIFKFFCILNSE